jgi:NADPH2:quinone reductase
MKAIQITGYGDPGVLAHFDLPDPVPGPGEIAIDVTHAAVGLIDVYFRQGLFKDAPGLPTPPFVPGLEVAGTVRALGPGVTGFEPGEPVVTLSANGGKGGYASVFISDAAFVASLKDYSIDPGLAVTVVPNLATAWLALTQAIHVAPGESVLVHGALGGLAAGFPGMARQLGASRVVGTVRSQDLAAAQATRLPYDQVVDSAQLPAALDGQKFDVVVDPVGGPLRSASLELLAPLGRLLIVGNASGDWDHVLSTTQIWMGNLSVAGFGVGFYLPTHKEMARPAAQAAIRAVADGLADAEVEEMPLHDAAIAHQRLEDRTVSGRIVLRP